MLKVETYKKIYKKLGFVTIPLAKGTKVPPKHFDLESVYSGRNFNGSNGAYENIGIVTGRSKLVVVDCDTTEAAEWFAQRPAYISTVRASTKRGAHFYYRLDAAENLRSKSFRGLGIDIKTGKSYVVAPPSIVDNHTYRWVPECQAPTEISEEQFWELIRELENRNRQKTISENKVPSKLEKIIEILKDYYIEGNRQNIVLGVAGVCKKAGMDAKEVYDIVTNLYEACHDTDPIQQRFSAVEQTYLKDNVAGWSILEKILNEKDLYELQKLLGKDIATAEPLPRERIIDEEFTDRNNSIILAQLLWDKALWVKSWGWMVWTGVRWERDIDEVQVLSLAKDELPKHYLNKALKTQDYKEREKLCNYARRAHGLSTLINALKLAKGNLLADPRDFDQDPWLLNCANGVLDLRTGVLLPHNPAFRLTKLCPVAYRPEAHAPTWERFLRDIFLQDQELIAYVQRALGYSITGDMQEDKFFICWGSGANGKSTLLQTLRRVLGDYAGVIPSAAIVHKGKDSHPTAVANLFGLRLAIAIETEEDQRLDEAQLKALTGRDAIRARFMHRDYFEFEPQAKIWLATNHRPLVRDTSPAIWRRIALIPFRRFFPPKSRDKTLEKKLWGEREGILTWLVQGCLEWQRLGLEECAAVEDATEGYRAEMDVLQGWLEERCITELKAVTPFKALYDDYVAWCSETGQELLSQRAFGNRLSEKGFVAVKVKGKIRARRGLRLRRSPLDKQMR